MKQYVRDQEIQSMTSGCVVCKTHIIPLLVIAFSEVVRSSSFITIHASETLYAEDHGKWSKNKRFPFVAIVKLKSHLFWKIFPNSPWSPFSLRVLLIGAVRSVSVLSIILFSDSWMHCNTLTAATSLWARNASHFFPVLQGTKFRA